MSDINLPGPLLIQHAEASLWQSVLTPNMSEAAVATHLEHWSRITPGGAQLLIDCRNKSFDGLAAQRLFSLEARRRGAALLPRRVAMLAGSEWDFGEDTPEVECRSFTETKPAWQWLTGATGTPSVILVSGSTGAGKSSFCHWLKPEWDGIYYCTDSWMRQLFAADKPETPNFDWYWERIQRAEAQMKELLTQHLAHQPAILDLGLSTRQHRTAWIEWAQSVGADVCQYYVQVDAEVRWQRVQRRNQEHGPTFELEVTRQMFEYVEQLFEEPSADECPLATVWG